MKKAKKNDMETMKEQLSSSEVQAIVVEEIAPPMRNVEKTPDQVIEKKQMYIANISEYMTEMVARVRTIRASSQEVRQIRSKEEQEIVAEILRHLSYKDELLRSRAIYAYAGAIIATLPSEPKMNDIKRVLFGENDLPGLLKLDMATETDKKGEAPIVKFDGRSFQMNGGQAAERANALKAAVRKACAAKVAEIKAKAKITKEGFLAGKPGVTFIDVPDEFVEHPNSKDGKKFLGGGALLVRSDGKVVRPAEFLGHFQAIMTEIQEAEIFISVRQLHSERLSLPEISSETFRLCRIFHSILRRGLAPELTASQKPAASAVPTDPIRIHSVVTNAQTATVH